MSAAPAHHAPLTFAQLLDDGEVVETRADNSMINIERSLTSPEKISFHDLLQAWCGARPETPGHHQVISAELRNSFFARVFKLWDSSDTQISLPELAPRKLKEASFQAGYLKENLPVTPSKRKRGITTQTNPNRMALKPAYLTVEFSSESEGKEFRLVWRDERGTRIPVDYVRYHEGVTKAHAILKAIKAWDRDLRSRVEDYNTKLIIALARMRIVRFAKAGTQNVPYIPDHLRVNGRILPCKLISDEFAEYFNVMKKVFEGLGNSQVGAPSHMM
ncbi:hypothetical protein H9Q72_000739 [Fusarium xylarioides]|uniref:Uncharacterized protein n=1 Tax=Fusarium xylarioides TaxID=221167 RepID=A0A9P7LF53_9HYPO|nr:hypothetical protein H9Q72_000739 [Fusarium xylarioides]